MSKYKGPMSAEELIAKLNNDSEFIHRRKEKNERLTKRKDFLYEFELPILQRLKRVGFEADSLLPDLVNKYSPLPLQIVEILLDSLVSCQNDKIRESIVRSLAATEVPFDGSQLAACFEATTSESLKFAVINTIATAPVHSIEDWLAILSKTSYWNKKLRDLRNNS